jgi:hypothetical protein
MKVEAAGFHKVLINTAIPHSTNLEDSDFHCIQTLVSHGQEFFSNVIGTRCKIMPRLRTHFNTLPSGG